jgi:hypothetical protein
VLGAEWVAAAVACSLPGALLLLLLLLLLLQQQRLELTLLLWFAAGGASAAQGFSVSDGDRATDHTAGVLSCSRL